MTVEQCAVLSDKKNGTMGAFNGAYVAINNKYFTPDISKLTLERRMDICDKYKDKASGKSTMGLIFSVHGTDKVWTDETWD